jgi:hypothetical protein
MAPGACIGSEDCDSGYVCTENVCMEGPDFCTGVEDCDPGYICVENACVRNPTFCAGDEDCDPGQICVEDMCVADPNACVSDQDCDLGQICQSSVCVADPNFCADDEACEPGEVCVENACIPGMRCVNDMDCVEENPCLVGLCEATLCSSFEREDGIVCDLPEVGDAECKMGECVPVNVTLGTEFVLVFQANYSPPVLSLFLSGPVATSGEVSIGTGFSEPFTVTPGEVTTVTLPAGSEVTANDSIEPDAAVHVTSEAPIAVYGLNQLELTTDAFAGLPTTTLGQRHRVVAWRGGINGPSQFAIAAIPGPDDDPAASTTVTITPSANGGTRIAGVPYTIEMNPFDAYQLQSAGDLTGTLIQSSRPVAVFGGNQCANVPTQGTGFCDHLVEQIPPVSTWGAEALTVPLAGRSFGDTFRIMADEDTTGVELEGAAPESFTLEAGQFEDRLLEGSYRISSDKPILVAQYSNGTDWDRAPEDPFFADPFMMLIPSTEQLLDSYTFGTPGIGFLANYANIVALTTDATANAVLLDGVPVPAGSFTALTGTEYSAAQVEITVGSHTLSAPNPVALHVYGFGASDSYGYPGGFSAGSIAP